MSSPASPEGGDGSTHLEATASGQATVYQAGRDLHVHHSGGTRRAVPGGSGADARCPYPGLTPFTAEQAEWFFGRDRVSADLLGRLNGCLAGGGPVMVVAASGAGKSSLLRAGLLPKVAEGGLTPAGSRRWPRVVFAPGARPLRAAASALLTAWPGGVDGPADPSTADLDHLLAGAVGAAGPGARAVLVVDQFEELFRLCEDEDERGAFISWLWRAASGDVLDGPAALAACAVRADFYHDCTRYPEIRQSLQDNQVIVGAMSPDELRQAITCPAEAAGLEIGPGLTELLFADLRAGNPAPGNGSRAADDGAGRLPLLAHALQATWQQRHGSTLTVEGYKNAGGIEHAIADTAERVFAGLDSAARQETRALFLHLVKIGDTSGEDIRRPVTHHSLVGDGDTVGTVIDAYTDSRLLTGSRDMIQITHEALLRAWPRLAAWLDDDRAGQLLRQRIEEDAADWDHARSDPSLLYRGARLDAAAAWAGSHTVDLGVLAGRFLAASRRRARRTGIILRGTIAVLAVLLLIAGITSVVAFQQRSAADRQQSLAEQQQAIAARSADEANLQHAIALSRQYAAESLLVNPTDPVMARQLAAAAWHAYPTSEASSAITTLLTQQQQGGILPADPSGARGVAFSPSGKLLATAGLDGTVRLWNPATGQPTGSSIRADVPNAAHDGGVLGVAFSPDGKLLATADYDGTVRLWNPATGLPVGLPLRADNNDPVVAGVYDVAFSPDGKILASADGDYGMRLWNPGTGQPIGAPLQADPSTSGGVYGVGFSPDGKLLATADGHGTVRLWNPGTGQPVGAPLRADTDEQMWAVAFSPDGKLLAGADGDGTVRLWNPSTGQPIGAPLQADPSTSGGVYGVGFSPDGKLLAGAGADGTVRLWNPATGQPVGTPLQAGSAAAHQVAFNPDGKVLAAADFDGTVRLWNPGTGQPIGAPILAILSSNNHIVFGESLAFAEGVLGVAFSPDGKLLASADADGTVRLWNPATGQPIGKPFPADPGIAGGVYEVAFSPDGKLLASADADSTVRLWNPATGQPIGSPLPADPGIAGGVYEVAFSPDGKLLASADRDGTVRFWNPATRKTVGAPISADPGPVRKTPGLLGGVGAVAFSPDGKLLASADADGNVRLWNPATGQPVGAPLSDPDSTLGGMMGVAFSPDGKLLASAGADGTVWLWNPVTGQPVSQPLPANGSGLFAGVNGVAFSPDGKLLASADADGTVRSWDVWLFADPYAAICTDAGPLTQQEWSQYAPGEPQPSC